MLIDTEILFKMQIEFRKYITVLYTKSKRDLFQVCKVDTTFKKQLM